MPGDGPVNAPVDEGATSMMHDVMPLTRLLGVEVVAGGPGETRARLAWREELCTGDGMLHGGAVMALADDKRVAKVLQTQTVLRPPS